MTPTQPATESIRVTHDQRERIKQMAQVHGMNAVHEVVEMLLTREDRRQRDRERRIRNIISMEAVQ